MGSSPISSSFRVIEKIGLVENSVEKAARKAISGNQQLQARAVSATTYAASGSRLVLRRRFRR